MDTGYTVLNTSLVEQLHTGYTVLYPSLVDQVYILLSAVTPVRQRSLCVCAQVRTDLVMHGTGQTGNSHDAVVEVIRSPEQLLVVVMNTDATGYVSDTSLGFS